jgi:DNA-binding transcriptional LysR family regulator
MMRDDSQIVRTGIGWGLWEPVNRVRLESERQGLHPEIEVFDVSCADDCNERLRNCSIDLAVSRPPFDSVALNVVPLFRERLLAVLSDDHPLAARSSIGIRELASEPLLLWDWHLMPVVFDTILELYAHAGIRPRTIPTPGPPANLAGLMLAASGKGTYLCIGVPIGSHAGDGVALSPLPMTARRLISAWRGGKPKARRRPCNSSIASERCSRCTATSHRRPPRPRRVASRDAGLSKTTFNAETAETAERETKNPRRSLRALRWPSSFTR